MKGNPFRRFRSGEVCREDGWYGFDGYVGRSSETPASLTAIEVPLRAGDAFPGVHHSDKPCYWKPIQGFEAALAQELLPTPVVE